MGTQKWITTVNVMQHVIDDYLSQNIHVRGKK